MTDFPRVVASERIFEGRVFGVRRDELRYDDDSVHRIDVVEHRISLAILATPAPDRLVLVRQYRHPAVRALWEVPAGTAEPGEDPLAGAIRELREETGYRAASMTPLEALYTTPGFCDEIMYFYHATELSPGEQALDEDERIEVATVSSADAWRLVSNGEIADCKTVLALLWLESGRGEVRGGFDR
ncbi:MAG TPA: NUDIX hydrolase [Candidatus Tumulicola sp.]|jgi:ADP-ribose pyrophosphatase